jgi:uncharacterized membrane protein
VLELQLIETSRDDGLEPARLEKSNGRPTRTMWSRLGMIDSAAHNLATLGSRTRLLKLAQLGLVAAICGAGYLAVVSLSGIAIAGCGAGSGCNDVLSSRWAYWLGVPVSLPALAVYLSLLAASWIAAKTSSREIQRRSVQVILVLSPVVFAAAVWFIAVQVIFIKAWCKYCLLTHGSASLASLCLLGIFAAKQPPNTASNFSPFRPSRSGFIFGGLAAVSGFLLLLGGQVVVRKGFYVVSPFSSSSEATHQLKLHHGQFKLNPKRLPCLGSGSATNFIVSLFDYTCSHCRQLHPLLKAAEERFAGRLGIICLPAPLDAECNPSFVLTAPANEHACEYAKLALAVWLARAEAFSEFDDWLFTSDRPPQLNEARAKAVALVGKKALDAALEDSWVLHQIETDVALYQANGRVIGDARLPQLVIGDVITHGAIERLDDLLLLLEQHAGLNTGSTDRTNSAPDYPR